MQNVIRRIENLEKFTKLKIKIIKKYLELENGATYTVDIIKAEKDLAFYSGMLKAIKSIKGE